MSDEPAPPPNEVFASRWNPGQATGWWGVLAGLVAVGVIIGAFAYSYFYLRLAADEWPPDGRSPLGFAESSLALVLPAGACASQHRRWHRGPLAAPAAISTAIFGTGFVAVQTVAVVNADLVLDRHAYDAIVIVLQATGLASIAAAIVVMAWCSWLDLSLDDRAARSVGVAWLWTTSALWLTIWAIIYVFPQVT